MNILPPVTILAFQKFIKFLFGILIVLVILNCAGIAFGYFTGHHSVYGIIGLVYFDSQGGLPFYFSSICLLLTSSLLIIIYREHKQNNLFDKNYWLVLSIGFLIMSIDEYVGIHRILSKVIREFFPVGQLFYFAWVIPGIILCLILCLYFLNFYLRLPRRFKVSFGISAVLFVGGAIGIEILDGFFVPAENDANLIYSILVTLEQTMEWGAVLMFLYSLTEYMKSYLKTIPISHMEISIAKPVYKIVSTIKHWG